MPKIRRIAVVVEIEEDDGTVSRHEANGAPSNRDSVVSIVPHYQAQYSRSEARVLSGGVVDVTVRLETRLLQLDDHRLFAIIHEEAARPAIVIPLPEIEQGQS